MGVIELKDAIEFTDDLVDITKSVFARAEYFRPLNPQYFADTWRDWMAKGFARTWVTPDRKAMLGAITTPNQFTGDLTMSICFWHAKPGAKNTLELLHAAERAAKEAGCVCLNSAAYQIASGDKMKRLHKILGYEETETIFRRAL